MKSMTATVLTALLAVAVAGCASQARTQAGPGHTGSPATAAANASVSYTLYTHCGIRFAKIGGRWFEADRPLSDGSGNPPPGWGNPSQPGTLRMLSALVAEFRDSLGHVVRFSPGLSARWREQAGAGARLIGEHDAVRQVWSAGRGFLMPASLLEGRVLVT